MPDPFLRIFGLRRVGVKKRGSVWPAGKGRRAGGLKRQSLFYRVDYERVLCGVACLLHVSNPLKFFLVIFTVKVLLLPKHSNDVLNNRLADKRNTC